MFCLFNSDDLGDFHIAARRALPKWFIKLREIFRKVIATAASEALADDERKKQKRTTEFARWLGLLRVTTAHDQSHQA